jgi:hypothetical protein
MLSIGIKSNQKSFPNPHKISLKNQAFILQYSFRFNLSSKKKTNFKNITLIIINFFSKISLENTKIDA